MASLLSMRFDDLPPIVRPAHAGGKRILQTLREVPVRAKAAIANTGRGPRVAFLPSAGRTQSSHLRIYNVAEELKLLGWRTVVLPRTLTLVQRHRTLSSFDPDIVVMQGARHDLNRPDLYADWPIVYDMDDADFHIAHLTDPVARAMPRVAAVMAGSAYISDWCLAAGAIAAPIVWTGTPVSTAPRPDQAGRPPVVAWAQTRPETYLREAQLVQKVMACVAEAFPGVRLRLYDRHKQSNQEFLDQFRAPGLDLEWHPPMAYADYLASFDDVAVSLAPLCPETPFSRGKSFGKVLAALDRKVPVVGSDACEHGRFFKPETGVITNHPDAWVSSIVGLLSDPERRQGIADRAFDAFCDRLTVKAAARKIDDILTGVLREEAWQRSA